MTLEDFLNNIGELVKKNPKYLQLLVVTAKDDEGNGYNEVMFKPSVGILEEDETEFNMSQFKEPTHICVN